MPGKHRWYNIGGKAVPFLNLQEGGAVDTGKLPAKGKARGAIDAYLAGQGTPLDFSKYQGTQGGGQSNYNYQINPAYVPTPVTQTPTDTKTTTVVPPITSTSVPTDAEIYGEYGSSVTDEAQAIRDKYVDPNLPFDPFDQGDKAAGTSWGGGVDEVIAARETLPEEFIPPPAPTPGTSQADAHAVVEGAFENFGENVLNNPDLTNAQKAAANPAFNPEIALANAHNQVNITSPAGESYTIDAKDLNSVDANVALGTNYSAGVDDFGYLDPFGGTAPVNGGTDGVAAKAEQAALASGANPAEAKAAGSKAKSDAIAKQYEILGNSVTAAGVSNIGGKFNQSGENAGLPDDYLIVGNSDGSQEVWGPGGETYGSIEEAQAAVPAVNAPPKDDSPSVTNTVKDVFSGGGSDNVGNFGAVGDFLGGIGDSLGITDYAGQAEGSTPPAETTPATPEETKAAQDKAKAELDSLARSGNASASQVSQAAHKAGLSAADRAKLTAQASASQKDSAADKARAAEAQRIEKENADKVFADIGPQGNNLSGEDAQAKLKELTGKNVDKKDAKDALDNLYNKGRQVANEQIDDPALKAIVTRDRGDLKTQLREAGISYKKDDSTSKLISKLENANPQLEDRYIKDNYGRVVGAGAADVAPPPPPPQPVAQAAPAPVYVAPTPPPQPVAQVTPAPTPAPAPVVAPPPAVLPPAPVADPFDWANNPNNPANAGAAPTIVPISEWENATPSKGK